MEGYDVDIPRPSADTSASSCRSQLILSIGSAGAHPHASGGPGDPEGLSGHPADQKIPAANYRAGGVDSGWSAAERRALFLAVDDRLNYEGVLRIIDLAKSGVEEFEDRICSRPIEVVACDNHGSEEHFQNVRGSDGPQHGEEPTIHVSLWPC